MERAIASSCGLNTINTLTGLQLSVKKLMNLNKLESIFSSLDTKKVTII